MANVEAVFSNGYVSVSPITKFSSNPILLKYEEIELMQFTGLEDKNGTEIYEGDVVVHDGKRTRPVRWNEEMAAFDMDVSGVAVDQECGSYEPSTIEVIGNIYENPELLK